MIKLSIRKVLLIPALLSIGLTPMVAKAADYQFPNGMNVSIERGDVPIYRSGSNVAYPITSYFSANWPTGVTNFVLTNSMGDKLASTSVANRFQLVNTVAVGDRLFFAESNEATPKPIRVLFSNPIEIGHLHFTAGSAKLSKGAKTVLKLAAEQMKAAGLGGAYLVGHSDRAGSVSANLTLSKARVEAATVYFKKKLTALGVSGFKVKSEFMGEYESKAKDGTSNIADRRVSILLYPIS